MATLLIKEIHIKSHGGWQVVLTGIDLTDSDFIVGTIDTPGAGKKDGKWNDSGILRGGVTDGNITPKDTEVADLIALAKKLGAP